LISYIEPSYQRGFRLRWNGRTTTTFVASASPRTQVSLTVREGRRLGDDDVTNGARVCLITSELAAKLFRDTSPTGQVIGTGLENETTDRRYLLIEGNDGKLHYIRQTPAIEKARGEDRLRIGQTVTLSGSEFEKNGRKVTYVQVAEHTKGRTR